MLRIGLVMLQGARHAHLHALNEAAKDLQIEVQDNGEKIVDANISRNAFGNQSESFQSVINSPLLSRDFPGIFIRAPRFLDLGGEASIVASIDDETVGVRTNNRIALTFHPELSGDFAFHKWLINKAAEVSK